MFLSRPDNAHLYLRRDGEGPPVLFVHGLLTDHWIWHRLAPVVEAAGYQVWRCDLRGHGRSSRGADSPTLETYQDDLLAIIDVIGEAATVIGLDAGGYISLSTALRVPSAFRAVGPWAVDPSPASAVETQGVTGAIRAARGLSIRASTLVARPFLTRPETQREDPVTHAIQQRTTMTLSPSGVEDLVQIALSRADLRPGLDRIEVPTLVLWGDLDRLLPAHSGTSLMRALPDATGGAVRDAAHLFHLDRHETVARALIPWLSLTRNTP